MDYLKRNRLFHGSLVEVTEPEILVTDHKMDFGNGFYCTTSQVQASKWTKSKLDNQDNTVGYVNIYSVDLEIVKTLNVRVFPTADEEWVDFVELNRQGPSQHDYDLVIGPVADDDVNRQMKRYENGELTKDELIVRLETYRLIDQYLFHTPKALSCLKFVGSKIVKPTVKPTTIARKPKGGKKL